MNTPNTPHGLRTPLEGTPAQPWDPLAPIDAPLCLHEPTVLADWVDYNGHMSESCFLLVFGDNTDAFFRLIGVDEAYRQGSGHSFYTVQTMIHHVREATLGDPLHLSLQLLDADDRRVHLFHSMVHGHSGELLATGEQLLTHVDMGREPAQSTTDLVFTLAVRDRVHLAEVLRTLKRTPSVIKAQRAKPTRS